MKKITVTLAVIIAIGALVAGFFIGILISGTSPSGNHLTGTIGKVDKNKKDNMTEKEIMLRNELEKDTAKLSHYVKYLTYNYYKSLKTSIDVDKVIKKTKTEEEFNKLYYSNIYSLSEFNTYLGTARSDLLTAIHVLETFKKDENLPLTNYINNAQNAISRIKYHDQIITEYLSSIEIYLADHSDKPHQGLKDAYDLLSINVLQTALITQNKPMLNYLEDKKFYNDNQGMRTLLAEVQLRSQMNSLLSRDTIEIVGFTGKDFEQILDGVDKLDASLSGEFIINQSGLLDKKALGKLSKNSKLNLGKIIDDQDPIVKSYIFNNMQKIVNEALMDACTPFCPG